MELVSKIQQLRKEKNWTRPKLAGMVGVTWETIKAYEVKGAFPSIHVAFRLANALNCKVDDLFEVVEENEQKGAEATVYIEIQKNYREASVECMKELCKRAGVQYRDPSESEKLLNEMNKNGYSIRIERYTNKRSLGQYLVLTDLDLNLVHGYKVDLNLKDFEVRKTSITQANKVPFLK